MNRLYTLLVLALAIACVAAQGAGRRSGGRAGASGGSSSDFGAEDAFFATDQQETNVNALDRNAAEARTEVDAESRDAAAVDAQSIDEASVDAGAREANRVNFDSQSEGGARGYKNIVEAQNLDFAAKDDFSNKVGVSYGLDEGGSDRVAVSASSGDALNQNQQVIFGENIHAASFDNQQALAEADASDAALVRGADEAASNLNAGEAAAVEDNFALSAGDARRSGVSSNSGVFGAEDFGAQSGFGGGFGDSVFSGFGGGSVFGGRGGFGGGGGFGSGGGFGNRGSGVLSLIGDRGFGGGSGFGSSGLGSSGFRSRGSFLRRRR